MKPEEITSIIENNGREHGGLILILEEIQAKYSYLPEEALRIVSEETGRSLVDIYGVATFFKLFSLKPRGRHLVSVCLGTACHVRGAPIVAEEFKQKLNIEAGETTKDREFTLETVNCLGACALGPIAVVDGRYFSQVQKKNVKDILDKAREGLDKVEFKSDDRYFPLEVRCSRCNHSLMDKEYLIDDHPSIRVTVSFNSMHGWMRISSLYGSYNVESEYDIPDDTVTNFFCPYCHTELIGASNCPECGIGMVPMIVGSGGVVQICPRKGCIGHRLDLNSGSTFTDLD